MQAIHSKDLIHYNKQREQYSARCASASARKCYEQGQPFFFSFFCSMYAERLRSS